MNNQRKQISICGIGPGNPDYISKSVWQEAEKADVLVGGKRQLEIFAHLGKKHALFDGNITNLKNSIEQLTELKIAVLVSGDTGFYSLRRFFKDEFSNESIQLFPGISSFQYFYAKLGLGYEHAALASMHGTSFDFIDKLNESTSVFLLTDWKNNYRTIASTLVQNGYGELVMHIGSNLSYPDEKILSVKAKEVVNMEEEYNLCSVIIENSIER